MGNQKKNFGMTGTQGKVGNVVFRQTGGRTIIATAPTSPETGSEKQIAHRRRFLKASIYAKAAIKDPALLAFYSTVVKPGMSAYSAAVTDYLTPPLFADGDTYLDEYFGRVGDKLIVGVTDEFKVTSVQAVIRDASGELVETVPLTGESNGLNWIYTVAVAHQPAGCEITLIATDRAGNRSKLVLRP